jgi:NO-binding membrane sensor protein with MHYT domain
MEGRGREYPRDYVVGKSKSVVAEFASVSLAFEVHQKQPPHVASVSPNSTLAFGISGLQFTAAMSYEVIGLAVDVSTTGTGKFRCYFFLLLWT